MKNIHVLPTDKPSRLRINPKGKIILSNIPIGSKGETQHIYITSDEEIKEGDWFICQHGFEKKCVGTTIVNNEVYLLDYLGNTDRLIWCKKIILTTDQDLIKDGVQAIDDEFLEWFVKNPSCEFVEVNKVSVNCSCANQSGYRDNANVILENSTCHLRNNCKTKHKIIIPKEEPKQETLTNDTDSHSWGFENFEVIKTEEDVKIFVETMENIPEPNNKLKKAFRDFNKQETLEEVALNYAKQPLLVTTKDGFIAGAKWQQEQDKKMYSEEEVFNLLMEFSSRDINSSSGTPHSIAKWFEQFKNK